MKNREAWPRLSRRRRKSGHEFHELDEKRRTVARTFCITLTDVRTVYNQNIKKNPCNSWQIFLRPILSPRFLGERVTKAGEETPESLLPRSKNDAARPSS